MAPDVVLLEETLGGGAVDQGIAIDADGNPVAVRVIAEADAGRSRWISVYDPP